MTMVNNTLTYLKVAKRVDFKSYHHKKKNLEPCTVMDVNQTLCGAHFTIYTNIEPLYCTYGTSTMIYVNDISAKKTPLNFQINMCSETLPE